MRCDRALSDGRRKAGSALRALSFPRGLIFSTLLAFVCSHLLEYLRSLKVVGTPKIARRALYATASSLAICVFVALKVSAAYVNLAVMTWFKTSSFRRVVIVVCLHTGYSLRMVIVANVQLRRTALEALASAVTIVPR